MPQTVVTAYCILALPGLAPYTVLPLTVAVVVDRLLHVPPVIVLFNEMDAPAHTLSGPVMLPAEGSGLMVIARLVVVVPQVLVTAYFIVSVPADTPVTMPEEVTVAIAV